MMKPDNLEDVIHLALGAHEALLRVGFEPDDVFIVINNNMKEPPEMVGLSQVLVELKTQGKEFSFGCGAAKEDKSTIAAAWKSGVVEYNDRSAVGVAFRKAIWDAFSLKYGGFDLVVAIMNKGIEIPRPRPVARGRR